MKKILVVDDSETIRQQVAGALGPAGFAVIEAADGVIALERAFANDISMVILDVNMPRLGGLEVLEKLKADERTARVPVLMLTTEAQQSMIERAKKAGAAAWLVKPAKVEQLVAVVRKLAI